MTGLGLICGSLRILGVLAEGETPSSQSANDALDSLNAMIDSWSNERLIINSIVREVFALVGGQQTYTFGTGGDFNSSRPMSIENALLQLPNSNPVAEVPVHVLNKDQYAAIILKALSSTLPLYLYNDDNYPLANINIYPVPSATCNLVLYSAKPVANIAALTTTITLPPGYLRALKYNLAVDLAPEYGRQLSPEAAAIAATSRADIKRMNSKPRYLRVDGALRNDRAGNSSYWNFLSGDSN